MRTSHAKAKRDENHLRVIENALRRRGLDPQSWSPIRCEAAAHRVSGSVTSRDLTSLDLSRHDLTVFVGRERELAVLDAAWTKAASAFIPIYGRRRVGKSELIAHFMRDKPGVQFVGKTAASELQLREFAQEAARVLDEPLLAEMSARGWQALLEAITERWTGDEKLVLAFDEFQWTCEASPELPSVLQQLWDRKWKKSGRVILILCGSFIGFMEREFLGKKSPLFCRRTAQFLLRPFNHL